MGSLFFTNPIGCREVISMEEEQEEKPQEHALPERSLECSGECRRPLKVI